LRLEDWIDLVYDRIDDRPRVRGDQFVPLVVEVSARSFENAFDMVERPYDMLRASINLAAGFNRMILMASDRQRAFGTVPPPPTYGVFDSSGIFEEAFLDAAPTRKYERRILTADDIAWSQETLIRLEGTAGELAKLALDSLALYGKAMDTADWEFAFLSLWQSLEGIAAENEDVKMDVICRRIAALLGNGDEVADIADALRRLRNLLVHRGVFSAHGVRIVNLAKWLVEKCIEALADLSSEFSTRVELQQFYAFASMPPRALEAPTRALQYVRKWKKLDETEEPNEPEK
jgi:hypothetical protein